MATLTWYRDNSMELRLRVDDTGEGANVSAVLRTQTGAVVWSGSLTPDGTADHYHAIIDPGALLIPLHAGVRHEAHVTATYGARTGSWVDRVVVSTRETK